MSNKTLEKWEEKTLGEIIYSISNGTSIKQVKNKTDFPVTRIETISNCSINSSAQISASLKTFETFSFFKTLISQIEFPP